MDKFTFNFGSSEPEEEVAPPPTQLEGVIFSFVPAPASELNQMEKDYQNYLNEWDHVKKLSAAQQMDLLQRSSTFIKNVKPGQFNIDKFADKMEYLYNNLDEKIKNNFYKAFSWLVPRRFASLELGLEKLLASNNSQDLEFGLLLLAMFVRAGSGADLALIITKYLPILKTVVEANLSGEGVLKNQYNMFFCLRKMSRGIRYTSGNHGHLLEPYSEIYEKVATAILPLKNYPANEDEQKLWWKNRANICSGVYAFHRRRKVPVSAANCLVGFFDYINDNKLVIPQEESNRIVNSMVNLCNASLAKRVLKSFINYWDWILLPGVMLKPEELANLEHTEHGLERIKKEEDILAGDSSMMNVISLILEGPTTLRISLVDKIIPALKSEDVMTKCGALRILPELFAKADYTKDRLDDIVKTILIPNLDHSHVAVRGFSCLALARLNSKSKKHLISIVPALIDKLLDLLLHDKFFVKFYAVNALNRFAVKMAGERLIESKIKEGHIKEIAIINGLYPLQNISALLNTDVFVNHAPMFIRDTLRRACDLLSLDYDDDKALQATEYFSFAKDIFMNARVVASHATLQAMEPIIVQMLEHPVFTRQTLVEDPTILGDVLDLFGFATFHIPLITKEFWDAFRVIFTFFQRTNEGDMFEEFLVPIGNYISRAPEHFLQIPNAINIVLEKINIMNLTEELSGWEFIVEVLSNLGKSEPRLVNGILDIAVKVMDERPRPVVLLHLFRAIWTAMYIDPRLTLQKLDAKQSGWWKKWEAVRAKADTSFGHVGKKIIALGMISLISLNVVVDVPKTVVSQTEGFAQIFKQLVPLLSALQDFESVDYIAPISSMVVKSAESQALRSQAKSAPKRDDDFDDFFDDYDSGDDDDNAIDFHGDPDEPLQHFDEVHEQLEIMDDDDDNDGDDGNEDLMQQFQQVLDGDDEDGVEEIEDQNESVLLKVDHLMLLFNARKNDPSKFDTILGALDEEERIAIEDSLKRVKIGPKSLLDQAIEFVGRHYERYETDPNMKRLNVDVVERINKWLVTPQPLPQK